MTQTNGAPEPALQALVRMVLPGLSDEDSADLAATAYDQLEERVGTKLAVGLSDAQFDEFEKLIDAGDDAACTRWLDSNVPAYPRIVAVEQVAVLGEIVQAVSRDLTAVRGHRIYTEQMMQTFEDVRAVIISNVREPDNGRADHGDGTEIGLQIGAGGPVVRWMPAASGPPRFIAVAQSEPVVGDEARAKLAELCDGWNSNCPAMCLRIIESEDGVRAVAEGAIPASIPMGRNQLSAYIDLACMAAKQAMSLVAGIARGVSDEQESRAG